MKDATRVGQQVKKKLSIRQLIANTTVTRFMSQVVSPQDNVNKLIDEHRQKKINGDTKDDVTVEEFKTFNE